MSEASSAPPFSMLRVVCRALFGARPKLYLFVALAVTAAITAAIYGVDYLLNPWAYAHAERPPLLGYWRGDIVFEPGDRRTVVEPDGGSRGTTSIDARSGAERRRIPFELRRSTKEEFDAACGGGAAAQD
jgi:hypothetical protein